MRSLLKQNCEGTKKAAKSSGTVTDCGAYLLYLRLDRSVSLEAGALGITRLPPGRYVYIGSARSGIAARVARHVRLAKRKSGRLHWHVDYLLVHPGISLTRVRTVPGGSECAWSQHVARRASSSVPVPGFGSSDCRAGCRAHLYRIA